MKLLKKTVWLLATISLVACGSDDDSSGPSFELTNETALGSFTMETLNTTSQNSVISSDGSNDSTETTGVGDTIGVELLLSSDRSFTIEGTYRLTTTNSDTNESTSNIITLDDSGTYELNIDEEEIIFDSENDDFLEGTYAIQEFDENNLEIFFEGSDFIQETDSTTSIQTTNTFTFSRVVVSDEE